MKYIKINGKEYNMAVGESDRMIDILRERLGLMGTKEGCRVGHPCRR